MTVDDADFPRTVAGRLAALPRVEAVSLGGSRAQATERVDSDWDFAIYYRGSFDPRDLRSIGWPGYVSAVGEWGEAFNGGAWLTIDGRPSDIHYRDLSSVERELADAQAGHFTIQPLMFHLAGIPTYLVLAELALGRVLYGELPCPGYPDALRRAATERWWGRAARSFDYADQAHARAGRVLEFAGLIGQAVAQAAHAIAAARGVWVTNDKQLLTQAGLHDLDGLIGELRPDPRVLMSIGQRIRQTCQGALDTATAG